MTNLQYLMSLGTFQAQPNQPLFLDKKGRTVYGQEMNNKKCAAFYTEQHVNLEGLHLTPEEDKAKFKGWRIKELSVIMRAYLDVCHDQVGATGGQSDLLSLNFADYKIHLDRLRKYYHSPKPPKKKKETKIEEKHEYIKVPVLWDTDSEGELYPIKFKLMLKPKRIPIEENRAE